MASIAYLVLAISWALFSVPVAGDYHGVSFLFPTDGLTLSHDDTVNVTYTSNFDVPLLYTFCQNSTSNNIITELRESVAPFNGSELVQLKWPNISSCYFDLRPNTSYGYGANSPSINVLATARAQPSTVGLAQSTSTSTSDTGTASSDGTPSSTPSADSKSSSGLSTGAKAGIGVGVALGVILVAAVVGVFLLRRRKAKSVGSKSTMYSEYGGATDMRSLHSGHGQHQPYSPLDYGQTPQHSPYEEPRLQELPSKDRPQELPAESGRYELR